MKKQPMFPKGPQWVYHSFEVGHAWTIQAPIGLSSNGYIIFTDFVQSLNNFPAWDTQDVHCNRPLGKHLVQKSTLLLSLIV